MQRLKVYPSICLAVLTLCALLAPARTASAAPIRYEAEDALVVQGVVESNHPGFTGTGFVNYDNVPGGYVEFSTTIQAAGSHAFRFRYANGSGVSRSVDVSLNGTVVSAGLVLPPTASWSSWVDSPTMSASFHSGTNNLRITGVSSTGGPNLDSLTIDPGSDPGTDWSVAMIESTMARYTPGTLGGWSYPQGLYLYGQYLVYQRTHDPRYLSYIKSWVDRFVDGNGNISQSFSNLDSMLAGRLLNILHKEGAELSPPATGGTSRYQIAAKKIRDRLNTYPRTSDGGFWHSTSDSRRSQLWADGVFMVNPFLVEYGREFGDSIYANNEATKQLAVYGGHLQVSNGLLRHAYDESRDASWSDPQTGLAPEHWCRAIGWYGMATIDILEVIPADHPRRAQLLTILRNLAAGLERYQDPVTGRWFQVVDKGSRTDNWTETSCSSMFTFTLDRAVERGYIDGHYQAVADKGYQGVLAKISLGSDGRTNLRDISIGTNVGDYNYYINRTRATNDFHGLGAFLIMNEQLGRVS